jgi:hypothetical protein
VREKIRIETGADVGPRPSRTPIEEIVGIGLRVYGFSFGWGRRGGKMQVGGGLMIRVSRHGVVLRRGRVHKAKAQMNTPPTEVCSCIGTMCRPAIAWKEALTWKSQ